MNDLVCGIDVGTSAVRVLISNLHGQIAASAACDLAPATCAGNRREQDPGEWWRATRTALCQALSRTDAECVRAVAVDATSGTIVLVNRDFQAISPGIMYNDGRAVGYGERINAVSSDFIARHGYRFKDDFALAKILWLMDHDPRFEQAHQVLHQSDFINAQLIGDVPATDWSNALKTGCDLHAAAWPDFLSAALAIPRARLPARVVAPGALLGVVTASAAAETGLRAGTAVVAGASDGTAALFASGASRPGHFNTALGSTITIKGITPQIVHDPAGIVYCHRHPSGAWLPGGASNVGCAALNLAFAPEPLRRAAILSALDADANSHLPSTIVAYPLGDVREERFPFKKRDIDAFITGDQATPEARYAAYLQAIAFVERWCYESLENLGARVQQIYSTGGGSKSRTWCRLRADILRKPLHLPEQTESAFGAALLAASHLCGSFEQASTAMVRIQQQIEPGHRHFDQQYDHFRATIRRRWDV